MHGTALNGSFYLTLGMTCLLMALPLIQRRVRMNHWYGVRFRAAFRSPQNWYAINAYGGRALAAASIPITLTGFWGVMRPGTDPVVYNTVAASILVLSLGAAYFLTWCYAQKR